MPLCELRALECFHTGETSQECTDSIFVVLRRVQSKVHFSPEHGVRRRTDTQGVHLSALTNGALFESDILS